jgi:hypothetical protein
VAIAVLVSPQPETESGSYRLSTRNKDPWGANALYEVLHALGWRTAQRTRPLHALDAGAVYVQLDPPIQSSGTEVHALLEAVRAGADAIVTPIPGTPLSDSLGVRRSRYATYAMHPVSDTLYGTRDSTGRTPRRARGVRDISLFNTGDARSFHQYLLPVPASDSDSTAVFPPDTTTLLAVRRGERRVPAILARRIGRGRVIAIGDPSFLSNGVLDDGDGAVLAVRLVEWLGRSRATPLVFDEYHHGFGYESSGASDIIVDALLHTGAGQAATQIGIAALLLLLVSGVRPIAPQPRERIERRSPFEHVGALSRAYEQIEATQLVAQRLVRGLRRRHPLGATGALSDDAYLELLRTRKPALAGDAATLRRALERTLPAAEFVAVGQAIDHIERTITQ